jgi:hypothetical protein
MPSSIFLLLVTDCDLVNVVDSSPPVLWFVYIRIKRYTKANTHSLFHHAYSVRS